jgi:hypothetical protein
VITKKRMLETVLAELYESGINCAIFSFLPDGFEVKLGDEKVGIRAETIFSSKNLVDVTSWLIDQARRHYPKSAFAKIAWA